MRRKIFYFILVALFFVSTTVWAENSYAAGNETALSKIVAVIQNALGFPVLRSETSEVKTSPTLVKTTQTPGSGQIFINNNSPLNTPISLTANPNAAINDSLGVVAIDCIDCNIPKKYITGFGSSTQVSFFTGSSTIAGSPGLFWDSKKILLNIGTPGLEIKIGIGDIAVTTAADIWHHGYYFDYPVNGAYVWGNQMLSVGPAFAYNQALFYGQGMGKNRGFQVVDTSKASIPPYFFVTAGARVGINTYNPLYTLDVREERVGESKVNADALCINGDCRTEWPRGTTAQTASPLMSITAKTSNYTVTATDSFIKADAASQNLAFVLPTAAGIQGKTYTFKKIDGSAHAVTVKPNNYETIDGASNYVIRARWNSLSIISDGSNWLTY